jgi:hypothetical protein
MSTSLRHRLGRLLPGRPPAPPPVAPARLAVTPRLDDSPGWSRLTGRPHDRDLAELQELYADSLTAWRQNPLARRIIAITTDYVVGDGLSLTSPHPPLADFVAAFWNHRQNRLPLRLEAMCEELARAGDLFPVLFRNPADGMSYLRFVTKDRIIEIGAAANDWESEHYYLEAPSQPLGQPTTWRSPDHPQAGRAPAVMLHYATNRPLGAAFGESDLATVLPWLLRYSRTLEERVRLHWALRTFLWFVRVPSHRIPEKVAQYRRPPESGSILVHDDGEEWQAQTPNLAAADAGHDLEALRRLIFAGSAYPPHWFGEPGSNLAEAQAMQAPAERHLRRRQNYFTWMLGDIVLTAYGRAAALGLVPPLPAAPGGPAALLTSNIADISRQDNLELARAGRELAGAFAGLLAADPPRSRTLARLSLQCLFKFIGEPQPAATLERMADEMVGGRE